VDEIASAKVVADELEDSLRHDLLAQERLAMYGDRIVALSPEPVNNFVPNNAKEQREAFIAGGAANPVHDYGLLEAINFEGQLRQLDELRADIQEDDLLSQSQKDTLLENIVYFEGVLEYMSLARDYNHAENNEERARLKIHATERTAEIWGGVDVTTYRGLLAEELEKLDTIDYDDSGRTLLNELNQMVPLGEKVERFRPSQETIQALAHALDALYGDLFAHIPENKDQFDAEEIRDVFEEILRIEFGAAVAGWQVIMDDINSINVSPTEKLIRIPRTRKPADRNELKGLVAHEIGVHLMRALSGADTDIPALATGLPNYYDSEEGVGKVFQQAVEGKVVDSGVPYYIIAGLIQEDDKDFRGSYEFMWRLNVLKNSSDGVISEKLIYDQQLDAYKSVMRVARGTDGGVAWTKDLAYYNGTMQMWRYFEENGVDELTLMNVILLGKGDITLPGHRRTMLNSRSAG
jgi:hypothetical protein